MSNCGDQFLIVCLVLLIADSVYGELKTEELEKHSKYEDYQLEAKHIKAMEKTKKGDSNNILTRLIPMLAIPYLIQTTFLPMMLFGIKFMLIQSIVLGKFAIIFWLVNLLKNRLTAEKGNLYSHNIHLGHG